MDFKPIPPSGNVVDLRNQEPKKEPTPEEIAEAKQQKHDRARRNLRLIAIGVAAYYFISAGYTWYQESQLEQASATAPALATQANPLQDPQAFRDTFNGLLNQLDTSLPLANANDSPEGFVAVLSTAIEIRGYAQADSKALTAVQIQTRYPDAFPPESLKSFHTFILTCERLHDPQATPAQADEILRQLGIEPQLDANENDKVFVPTTVNSAAFSYASSFTSGPIDELTIVATPRALTAATETTAPEAVTTTSETVAPAAALVSDTATSAAPELDSDVPSLAPAAPLPPEALDSDVPQL